MTKKAIEEGKTPKVKPVSNPAIANSKELSVFKKEIINEIHDLKRLILAGQDSKMKSKKPTITKKVKNAAIKQPISQEEFEWLKKTIREKFGFQDTSPKDK